MLKYLLHGIRIGFQQWRVASIVYVIQLFMALTLGMQVYEVLNASIGNSLEINKLLSNYDHTVITDFLKVHGASITPLIGLLRWLLLTWLLFSIFTNGGVLFCMIHPQEKPWTSFWNGAAQFFFRFLKISGFFILLALVLLLLILAPVAINIQPALVAFSSEKIVVWGVFGMIIIGAVGLAYLYMWSVISRWVCVEQGQKAWYSIQTGRRLLWKHFAKYSKMALIFAGMEIFLLAAYWGIDAIVGMHTPALIAFMFLVQQGFVFLRITFRQMMYASIGYITR